MADVVSENGEDRRKQPNPTSFQRLVSHPPTHHELFGLEPVYEEDSLDCSFGFRPERSAHDAIRTLRDGIMDTGQRWVIDADISKYFDSIDHGHVRSFLDLRIRDGVIRRMIDKWLNAGVLDQGTLSQSVAGTPQGGVFSPLLANIFLHHVLDRWFVELAKPRLKRRCQMVRYADDCVPRTHRQQWRYGTA
jgi:retron-type reverse transcriptase